MRLCPDGENFLATFTPEQRDVILLLRIDNPYLGVLLGMCVKSVGRLMSICDRVIIYTVYIFLKYNIRFD